MLTCTLKRRLVLGVTEKPVCPEQGPWTCCPDCFTVPDPPPEPTVETFTGSIYSIGDKFLTNNGNEGDHFHSGSGVSTVHGAPPASTDAVGELGGFFGDESIRTNIEMLGITPGASPTAAVLLIDVKQLGGLSGQPNYEGQFDVYTYTADDSLQVSDYSPAGAVLAGSSSTVGVAAGSTISIPLSLPLPTLPLGLQLRFNTGSLAAHFAGFQVTNIVANGSSIPLGGYPYFFPGDEASLQADLNAWLLSNGGGTSTVLFDGGSSKISIVVSGQSANMNYVQSDISGADVPFDNEDNFAGAIVFENPRIQLTS